MGGISSTGVSTPRLTKPAKPTDIHISLKKNHHHLSLNSEDRFGTTDDFTTSFPHCPLFSTAPCNLANSRPVHSLMLSSHLLLCLPCLLPLFTVPCKMVSARPDERETCHHHHHHHQSLNREGRWGTIDDFATSFLQFSLFSTALCDFVTCRTPGLSIP